MATFTTIADTVLEPGKPIRSVDILALRDNPIAIAGGAAGAPRVVTNAIQDANVTAAKLASNSVTTVKIANANVTTAKLATNERMTTANVLSATAGASAGAVGTYAFAWRNSTATPPVFGATIAGSQLRPAGFTASSGLSASANGTFFNPSITIIGGAGSSRSSFAGTWRCMGEAYQGSGTEGNYPHTLWLRIS